MLSRSVLTQSTFSLLYCTSQVLPLHSALENCTTLKNCCGVLHFKNFKAISIFFYKYIMLIKVRVQKEQE